MYEVLKVVSIGSAAKISIFTFHWSKCISRFDLSGRGSEGVGCTISPLERFKTGDPCGHIQCEDTFTWFTYHINHILVSVQYLQIEKLTHISSCSSGIRSSSNTEPVTYNLQKIIRCCPLSAGTCVPRSPVFNVSWCLTLTPMSSFPWPVWPLLPLSFLTLVYYQWFWKHGSQTSSIRVTHEFVRSINYQSYPRPTESERLEIGLSATFNKPFRWYDAHLSWRTAGLEHFSGIFKS